MGPRGPGREQKYKGSVKVQQGDLLRRWKDFHSKFD